MTIYDELQGVASEVLGEFNQGGISLVKITPGGAPADNPGTPTITVYELEAVARGVSFKYVQSGFAVQSDLQVTAAVLEGVTPNINDFIRIDGTDHKIIEDVSAPAAAGTRAAWKFIVRKGC